MQRGGNRREVASSRGRREVGSSRGRREVASNRCWVVWMLGRS